MKPHDKKPETVYRILDRETFALNGSYSRSYCTEYDFESPSSARGSNCHGIYEDRAKYRIAKYRVTYELIDDDVDPPTEEELEASRVKVEKDRALETEMDSKGIEGFARAGYSIQKAQDEMIAKLLLNSLTDND